MSTSQLSSRPDGALVGVLGGMGPLATAEFYRKLIVSCSSERDQDHVPVLIWGDPSTPDRSEALLAQGEDPTPHLRRAAQVLKNAGASVIVVPCNTAHLFIEQAIAGLNIRLLSMVDETVRHLIEARPAPRSVGLLATTGTCASGLYQDALEAAGITALLPNIDEQANVMSAIRSVKAGDLAAGTLAFELTARSLAERGAEAVIAGCTEVPLALPSSTSGIPLIDPTQIVIDRIVTEHRLRRDQCPL